MDLLRAGGHEASTARRGHQPAPLSRAEIIAVGTEMLAADRTDTNSLAITATLHALGIEVVAKAVVADHLDTLVDILGQALARADLVVVTGGLGPTDDDLTRQAAARVLERDLVEVPAIVEAIRARFERRGWRMPDINRRQALVLAGAMTLDNPNGTAPGMWVDHGDKVVVMLPGPPREMGPMLEAVARERLAARVGAERIARRTVRLVGRTESHAEERLRPLYASWGSGLPPVAATILAARGQVELQLSARAVEGAAADAALDRAVSDVVEAFGLDVCSTDGRELERVVGDLLRVNGCRLAIAESCTGGLVASRLTDVPGSSDYVEGGVVAYSNRLKTEWLSVPADVIAVHGAVSEPVALAMAEGVRRRSGAQLGLGVTGVAGPGGGREGKPVGTVVMALAGPGDRSRVVTRLFPGNRSQVKVFSSTAAIDLVRRALLQ
jgi:nicotinamide-nucleotide amidase